MRIQSAPSGPQIRSTNATTPTRNSLISTPAEIAERLSSMSAHLREVLIVGFLQIIFAQLLITCSQDLIPPGHSVRGRPRHFPRNGSSVPQRVLLLISRALRDAARLSTFASSSSPSFLLILDARCSCTKLSIAREAR